MEVSGEEMVEMEVGASPDATEVEGSALFKGWSFLSRETFPM